MQTREKKILAVVDELIVQYDAWQDDPAHAYIDDESPLDDAAVIAIATCEAGDVPGKCRELITAVARFSVEFDKYKSGLWDVNTLQPVGSFVAAYEEIVKARDGAEPFVVRQRETVRQLRQEQKLNDQQIAKAFGRRNAQGDWEGLFYGPNGDVQHDLIQKECDKKGSVIKKGWIHPDDQSAMDARKEELQTRLSRLEQRKAEVKETAFTEEELVSYLAEGAFASQAAKVYKISIDEVHRIAEKHGMSIDEKPDMSQIPEPEEDTTEVEPESVDEKAIVELIVELYEDKKLSAPEIAKQLTSDLRTKVTPQKAAAVIREHKKLEEATA